jgi:hypothetical protein
MHYWRKQYFETLKNAAASAVSQSANWQDYADFCLEYERGFRVLRSDMSRGHCQAVFRTLHADQVRGNAAA